jgi:hypothetical protein
VKKKSPKHNFEYYFFNNLLFLILLSQIVTVKM